MHIPACTRAGAFLVLLCGTERAFGQQEVVESSCNSTKYFSVRSAWASDDEPCHQNISLDMWTFMRAQGSAQDADAQHVYVQCLQQPEMGLVELITPEDWNSDIFSQAPGEIVGETEHAASLLCKGAEDFEAICNDEEITRATRVAPFITSKSLALDNRRRLKATTSEAGVAHHLIELLLGLGLCRRNRGEDQTICIISDSFNNAAGAADLQASGDLPDVSVVKDLPGTEGSDEGSAMMELAFDIASGSNFKFNTGFLGEQTLADDIGVLADAEGCDVIVDDIGYVFEPSFRDGVIANAINAASQDHGVLYFSSAGNHGHGHRFLSDWECQEDLFSGTLEPCTVGVSAHVFDQAETGILRYVFRVISTTQAPLVVKWDDDEGSARGITMAVWRVRSATDFSLLGFGAFEAGRATIGVQLPGDRQEYSISLHRTGGGALEEIDMQLVSLGNDLGGSTSGSMFGHACATNAISVAAMAHSSATGYKAAFADPETASVEEFSSRGPCVVAGGQGLTTRNHPVTTAADGLQTSTPGFNPFFGTSASAPVAAAIAAIVRSACLPKVLTYSDIMGMLTDYDYTNDVTSDAGGAPETFGPEAGYGIISPLLMCQWVLYNCRDSCDFSVGAHGDPHLVGLAGQKFDFTGRANSWYALLSAWGTDHVNMRVTAPVDDLPVVTYITGISVQTEDANGVGHNIVIFVNDPNVLDTSCPAHVSPCIGEGAITVLLDGLSVTSPGKTILGPGVSVAAANIPGECRPFGFERYWQQKVREAELLAAQARRRLSAIPAMDLWIAGDPSATNPTECRQYVAHAVEHDSLFTHQSDHVSFQIITPKFTLRLNHGKLHQLPERDPTDTFDIPDHTTFQMNVGIVGIKRDDTMQGIIGETSVPTIDDNGGEIMSGLKAIRGQEYDYKVDGPLGRTFNQLITVVK